MSTQQLSLAQTQTGEIVRIAGLETRRPYETQASGYRLHSRHKRAAPSKRAGGRSDCFLY